MLLSYTPQRVGLIAYVTNLIAIAITVGLTNGFAYLSLCFYINLLGEKMKEPKQVIVVRKDLKMGKGKMCAQVAHASMKVILDYADRTMHEGRISLEFGPYGPVAKWLFEGKFTKICVGVESEKELDMIFESAKAAGLCSSMIVDNGLTQFNGIFTKTCIAIGPDYPDRIDLITRHLPLL